MYLGRISGLIWIWRNICKWLKISKTYFFYKKKLTGVSNITFKEAHSNCNSIYLFFGASSVAFWRLPIVASELLSGLLLGGFVVCTLTVLTSTFMPLMIFNKCFFVFSFTLSWLSGSLEISWVGMDCPSFLQ